MNASMHVEYSIRLPSSLHIGFHTELVVHEVAYLTQFQLNENFSFIFLGLASWVAFQLRNFYTGPNSMQIPLHFYSDSPSAQESAESLSKCVKFRKGSVQVQCHALLLERGLLSLLGPSQNVVLRATNNLIVHVLTLLCYLDLLWSTKSTFHNASPTLPLGLRTCDWYLLAKVLHQLLQVVISHIICQFIPIQHDLCANLRLSQDIIRPGMEDIIPIYAIRD